MAWQETTSPHFAARHADADAAAVVGVLELLEGMRERLEQRFEHVPAQIAVVVHPSRAQLTVAAPQFAVARRLTAPASRRYLAGWFGESELHVLAPRVLAARASQVPGSRELNLLAPAALLVQIVLGANNPTLPPPFTAAVARRYRRWAWLSAGAGQWLSGATAHARPAIARRLHEGRAPAFPPGIRDAQLLGGSVLELLAHERGDDACTRLLLTPAKADPARALTSAFGGGARTELTERWRRRLASQGRVGPRG